MRPWGIQPRPLPWLISGICLPQKALGREGWHDTGREDAGGLSKGEEAGDGPAHALEGLDGPSSGATTPPTATAADTVTAIRLGAGLSKPLSSVTIL